MFGPVHQSAPRTKNGPPFGGPQFLSQSEPGRVARRPRPVRNQREPIAKRRLIPTSRGEFTETL